MTAKTVRFAIRVKMRAIMRTNHCLMDGCESGRRCFGNAFAGDFKVVEAASHGPIVSGQQKASHSVVGGLVSDAIVVARNAEPAIAREHLELVLSARECTGDTKVAQISVLGLLHENSVFVGDHVEVES